jgi:hypothetical protein
MQVLLGSSLFHQGDYLVFNSIYRAVMDASSKSTNRFFNEHRADDPQRKLTPRIVIWGTPDRQVYDLHN